MFELSEQMKALRTEAQALNKNGEVEKATAKLDEYDALKKEFEAEKRIFESEKDFMPEPEQVKDKGVSGTGENEKHDAVKDFANAARHKFLVEKKNIFSREYLC